jgi:hypothetical protein
LAQVAGDLGVGHLSKTEKKMSSKIGGASRIIRSLSFAIAASYGTSAFAYDPVDCLNEIGTVDPGIIVGLATKLCSGAWTREPVKCYLGATKADDGISRGIAIDLCAGAVNAENTIACYVRAGTERKLSRGLATSLCGAKKSERQP